MAATNTQFSIATHILTTLGERVGQETCSDHLAESVNANASFVRRIVSKLSKAGLVHTHAGSGGNCSLAKSPSDISLLDVYRAVEAPQAFAIHNYPENKECKVSCNIKSSMEKVLDRAQKSLEDNLRHMSLWELMTDVLKD